MPGVGKLSYPLDYMVNVEWEIEDFFNVFDNVFDNSNLLSPDFWFCDASWYLGISRNKEKKGQYFDWISLYLYRNRHGESNHDVACKLAIRDINKPDEYYNSQKFMHKFDSSSAEACINFLEHHKILELKDILVPDGTLTVSCCVCLMDSSVVEMHCRTTIPEGLVTLVQNFKDLCISECHGDTTVKVQDQEFQAHRSILAARSSVFASMFEHETTEKLSGVVNIQDCDPNYFKEFLLYLYTGQADKVSSDNVLGLYKTADKYDLKELKEECVQFIIRDMSVDSFCDAVNLAALHKDAELENYAKEFFSKNLKPILLTQKWKAIMKDNTVLANELLINLACKAEAWKTDLDIVKMLCP